MTDFLDACWDLSAMTNLFPPLDPSNIRGVSVVNHLTKTTWLTIATPSHLQQIEFFLSYENHTYSSSACTFAKDTHSVILLSNLTRIFRIFFNLIHLIPCASIHHNPKVFQSSSLDQIICSFLPLIHSSSSSVHQSSNSLPVCPSIRVCPPTMCPPILYPPTLYLTICMQKPDHWEGQQKLWTSISHTTVFSSLRVQLQYHLPIRTI